MTITKAIASHLLFVFTLLVFLLAADGIMVRASEMNEEMAAQLGNDQCLVEYLSYSYTQDQINSEYYHAQSLSPQANTDNRYRSQSRDQNLAKKTKLKWSKLWQKVGALKRIRAGKELKYSAQQITEIKNRMRAESDDQQCLQARQAELRYASIRQSTEPKSKDDKISKSESKTSPPFDLSEGSVSGDSYGSQNTTSGNSDFTHHSGSGQKSNNLSPSFSLADSLPLGPTPILREQRSAATSGGIGIAQQKQNIIAQGDSSGILAQSNTSRIANLSGGRRSFSIAPLNLDDSADDANDLDDTDSLSPGGPMIIALDNKDKKKVDKRQRQIDKENAKIVKKKAELAALKAKNDGKAKTQKKIRRLEEEIAKHQEKVSQYQSEIASIYAKYGTPAQEGITGVGQMSSIRANSDSSSTGSRAPASARSGN